MPAFHVRAATLMGVTCLVAACAQSNTTTPTPTLDPVSDAGKGMALFQSNCAQCHALADQVAIVGPSLAHIGSRAAERVSGLSAEDYLRESILYPNSYVVEGYAEGTMQQNFAITLTSEEVDQLVAYLLTLE